MNQPPLTIFSDNGVLKGAIMPERPIFSGDEAYLEMQYILRDYETAKREAIEKALAIGNAEEWFIENDVLLKDGQYVWPGSYEVREAETVEDGGGCYVAGVKSSYLLSIK